MATIEPAEMRDGYQLDKRTYLPFIVKDCCPNCGAEDQRDLRSDYLSYPMLEIPAQVYFECSECQREWRVLVVVGFTLSLAKTE